MKMIFLIMRSVTFRGVKSIILMECVTVSKNKLKLHTFMVYGLIIISFIFLINLNTFFMKDF